MSNLNTKCKRYHSQFVNTPTGLMMGIHQFLRDAKLGVFTPNYGGAKFVCDGLETKEWFDWENIPYGATHVTWYKK